MKLLTLHALAVYAIGRDALSAPLFTVLDQFSADANHMHMSLEDFSQVVLHDAAQDIKLGHSYGIYDDIVSIYYNTK